MSLKVNHNLNTAAKQPVIPAVLQVLSAVSVVVVLVLIIITGPPA